jgi:hypothetical protein
MKGRAGLNPPLQKGEVVVIPGLIEKLSKIFPFLKINSK